MTTTPTRGRHREPGTRNWKRTVLITLGITALLVVISAVLAGCTDTDAKVTGSPEPVAETTAPEADPEPVSEPEPAAEPEPEPTPEPTEDEVAEIGSEVTITEYGEDLATVVVTDLRVETTAQVDYGDAPKNGYFLIFTVELAAEGTVSVFEDDFYVRTEDGTRYDFGGGNSWDAADYDDQLGYVELNAGERKTGLLVFDVPEPVGELAYAPNYDSGPIVVWAFSE